ncbi:MAG: hypothetical protein V1735_04995 [Nanoarchaeota archaeon]
MQGPTPAPTDEEQFPQRLRETIEGLRGHLQIYDLGQVVSALRQVILPHDQVLFGGHPPEAYARLMDFYDELRSFQEGHGFGNPPDNRAIIEELNDIVTWEPAPAKG